MKRHTIKSYLTILVIFLTTCSGSNREPLPIEMRLETNFEFNWMEYYNDLELRKHLRATRNQRNAPSGIDIYRTRGQIKIGKEEIIITHNRLNRTYNITRAYKRDGESNLTYYSFVTDQGNFSFTAVGDSITRGSLVYKNEDFYQFRNH